MDAPKWKGTVDGRNFAAGNRSNRWFIHVYPMISRFSTIPGGAGFLPSTVAEGKGNISYVDSRR